MDDRWQLVLADLRELNRRCRIVGAVFARHSVLENLAQHGPEQACLGLVAVLVGTRHQGVLYVGHLDAADQFFAEQCDQLVASTLVVFFCLGATPGIVLAEGGKSFGDDLF